ncbi:MAG: chromosome segregation protein SMC [Ruminococcaceae bacterium]|nr:chromosome segregation protein SMC [Oscillospiraceae bacterium]
MVLKALEIHGFKSFPDRTVLSFGEGITAVVGPNGSGKSNISDAIRWVLGEQSNKSLRGSKMEDVIFSGTEERRAVGFAEVSLIIDNSTRILDFDSDDVKVTRRYYRSGDSEYMLNNATVRLKDIQLLFMDTGLGRDGYSIVGQGRIGDIVASKSEERREIFEEAAGIAKYRYRKNEAERRLNATEDNLLRLRDIVKELEDRVGPLAEQSEKAKAFLQLSEEKKGLEIGLWLYQIDRSRDVLRSLQSKLELARTQYDAAGADIDRVEAETEEIAREAQALAVQMDEIRRAAAALEEEALRAESESAVLRNDIFHRGETIERVREDIRKAEEGRTQIDEEVARHTAGIAEEQAKIEAAQAESLTLSEQMEALSRSSEEVTGRMDTLSAEAAALALELSDIRVKRVSGETALSEITMRLSQLTAGVTLRSEQAKEAEAERAACEKDRAAVEETLTSLRNSQKGYTMRLEARQEKSQTLKEEADRLTLDAEAAARRVSLLEEMERNLEGFSESVKTVVKQAGRGMLRGLHGPVSGLVHAQKEYALAVETALGAATQHVICDREEDAKRAIAYLKENRAGRVTFLPIASMKGTLLTEKGLEDEEGFIGLASDLVTCDKQYEEIARSLLGRIAVVEDLDRAVEIARKYKYRFRLVTLDGQVINAGGSMTGGSSVRSAGLLSRRAEIEQLKTKAEKQKAAAAEAREKAQKALQETAAVEAEVNGLAAEISVAQEDAIRLDGELRRLTELSENSRREAENAAREVEQLNTRAAEQRAAMEGAEKTAAAITEKQAALEAQMAEISGGRQQLSDEREVLATRIGDVKLAILSHRKEIEAHEAAIADLRAREADSSGYREGLEAQIAAIEAQNAETEQRIEELAARAAALREQAKAGLGEIETLMQRRDEGEQRQTECRRLAREKSDEREQAGREVARLEEKVETASHEAEDIVRKLYDEYELTRAEAELEAPPIEEPAKAGRRLGELKSKIRALGNVNVAAIEEYREVSERYNFMSEQVRDVEVSKEELLKLIGDLTSQMRDIFVERFRQINQNFSETFTELFGGGQAKLELADPNDILHSGIEMHVQPPGKKILNLDSLSGGEKALVAIALLFAILHVTPSPFCVLDEIEAALDDVNVDRYASYLRRMCDKTQFIVITHRRGSMEEADVLYGVTMQEKGVSKLLELRASEVEQKLGISLQQQ